MTEYDHELRKSKACLGAARVLLDTGFFDDAVSRAYYAAFHAAQAALNSLGITRSKHAGVLSAFSETLVRTHGFDPDVAAQLRLLFEDRNDADYGPAALSAQKARSSLSAAERFVTAVDKWLAR